jgi:hypothetical protein
MKKSYTIVWEKWRDPFGSDEDGQDHPSITEQPDDEEIYNPYEEDDSTISTNSKEVKCKILITPMGAIPYNEFTASGKIFNFWTGHSNFTITNNIVDIIEDTEGVETLDVFTRYRFRIAIGKAFSDSEVMRKINSNIYEYIK